MPDKEEVTAEYTRSTQQLDLEARLAAERGERDPDRVPRDFSGGRPDEELDAFVGVDPIYRNYADDTGKPSFAEEGSAEGEFEQRHVDNSDRIVVGFSSEEQKRRDANARGEEVAEEQKSESPSEERSSSTSSPKLQTKSTSAPKQTQQTQQGDKG